MSTKVGIAVMMNNYFHDVATALLLASGLVMWIIVKKYEEAYGKEVTGYFIKIYGSVTRIAKFSLLWIIIGGIPRTIAYKEFEWANAAGKDQVPALIIKHIIAFVFVGCGAYIWIRIHKKIKKMES